MTPTLLTSVYTVAVCIAVALATVCILVFAFCKVCKTTCYYPQTFELTHPLQTTAQKSTEPINNYERLLMEVEDYQGLAWRDQELRLRSSVIYIQSLCRKGFAARLLAAKKTQKRLDQEAGAILLQHLWRRKQADVVALRNALQSLTREQCKLTTKLQANEVSTFLFTT